MDYETEFAQREVPDRVRTERRVGNLMTKVYRQKFANIMASLREVSAAKGRQSILMALAVGDRISQAELVERTTLDQGTVARGVAKLIDAGLVVRERDPDARHGYLVSLTQAGWEAADLGLEATDAWNEQLYADLSDEDLERLRVTMERLATRSQELRDEKRREQGSREGA